MFVRPLEAAVKGYQLPDNHTSQNPPVERPVIRPGAGNSLVLGLIGPLARGQAAAAGFFLETAHAGELELRYVFARGGERIQVVFTRPGERAGHPVGSTRTFAVFVEGDAEPAVM